MFSVSVGWKMSWLRDRRCGYNTGLVWHESAGLVLGTSLSHRSNKELGGHHPHLQSLMPGLIPCLLSGPLGNDLWITEHVERHRRRQGGGFCDKEVVDLYFLGGA